MDIKETLATINETLENLQIKIAYQEDTIETLNQTIIDQQDTITVLQLRLDKMVEKVRSISETSLPSEDNIELPPHY